MIGILSRLIAWLAGKVVVYAVILGLLLVVFMIKILPPMLVKYQERELERAIGELSESRALVGEYAEKVKSISEDINARSEELRELERKRQEIQKGFDHFWNRVFHRQRLAAEKKRIEARERKLREKNRQAAQQRRKLQTEGGEGEEELAQRELLRAEKERQLRDMQGMRAAMDSLMKNQMRDLALKALLILAGLIVIPFLWKLVAYYVVAPLAQSAEPILLGADHPRGDGIAVSSSAPAQRLSLEQGEVLMTKVDYLQGSMGSFEKGTKWLMDWRYPFSSLAAGQPVLTRIRNQAPEPGEVTLSTREDATEELAVVTVPEGVYLVFRPHYPIALAHPIQRPPRIRSKWIFSKLHAWVNLQFRYMLIEGPARLVFSAQRGIQVEEVAPALPGRRVNSHLTMAFSPQLNYSPQRAETFVAYVWGKNALFDDFFQGSGIVIQQQVTGGKRNPVARAWESIFGAIGKVFGI